MNEYTQELLQSINDSVAQRQADEHEAAQRQIDAQNSSIQTAKILHHMEEQLQVLNKKVDTEQQERQKSEKANTKFQLANLILVALTLLATIVFGLGLHSCTSTITDGTSETQGSEVVIEDSAPEQQS